MDFMKVLDQTVREMYVGVCVKREVNLKVLKVPEIEQKVLDTTDDEPWGPHGTVLAEIAQATKKYTECQMIMNVLWTRLAETGKNWRLVYKALAVIEYLVAQGSERAVDDIVEHTYQISVCIFFFFEYVEPSGKDVGINVRKKSETIVALLNDKDKIQAARHKAAANREKYIGLSSSGMTTKSAGASFSSSSSRSNDQYRGFRNTRESYASNDNYKGKDRYGDDKYMKTTKAKREPSRHGRKQDSPVAGTSITSTITSKTDIGASNSSQNAQSDKYDEDFDDFDPRGISSSKPSAGSNQVDLFAQNFVGLFDAPVSLPTDYSTNLANNSSEVDLFADAAFVSTTPGPDSGKLPAPQTNVDLFSSQTAPAVSTTIDLFAPQPAPAVSTTMDFFAAPDPVPQLDDKASKPETTSNTFDPFAAIPMSNFELTSHADPLPIASDEISPGDACHAEINGSLVETNPPLKKEAFQVKSGIWADTLSRGLIDLNITAPKKVNLADIGIVGGLTDGSDAKDKGPLPWFNMGIAMGVGSGGSQSALSTSASLPTLDVDFFSSLSSRKHHTGSFHN
ncbi:hypothetical protein C2S53_009333 [Perilla frutescens var. hirtella]|uniref:ENTH domain-containing protein n=1 Tax=Perilla frutescens var. hirtella TaxID=608512 RepID=A0AAD4JDF6_PERFH|nr:hypothetical protein C2S53_009333 [Perilla frutescens var. hirtella]